MIKKILYIVIASIWFIFSLLPLWFLYILSDILYFPLYYCVRYRRKLVRKNLIESFPEKSLEEIIKIEKDYYSFLCDYIVETVKMFSMGKKQMSKRMRFEEIEEMRESMKDGNSCVVYLGHYCNWEWITSLPLVMDEGVISGQIYHALENEVFDKLFLYLRGRFDAVSIPMAEILRKIVLYRREKKQIVIGFISDQAPFWNNIHYWTDFLNHDTPVLTGGERIAKQTGFAVYYADITRPRRGYYVCNFKKLTDTPKEYPDYEITEMYTRALENTIRTAPQYWLWTHNRWKRTREEYNKKYDEITKRVRL